VRITVTDSGPGIPADVLPRIFDPFFTTKEVGQGTGLGLTLTYGVIQEHGGTIHAANSPTGGATITIELPAAPAVEESGAG
jgi:signal transduction histidine kinase